jgi:ribose/xylose/arabinose/galactoside ABC-type transport system permease subunit
MPDDAAPGTVTLRLLRRPELAAVAGAVLVWAIFALISGETFVSAEGTASYLNAAAPLGILAVAVALLMIAGEFDLSVGSIIGAAGMCLMLLTSHLGWGLWPAVAVTFLFSLGVGMANGLLVVRTGLPSFIVTLATLFVLRGLTIGKSALQRFEYTKPQGRRLRRHHLVVLEAPAQLALNSWIVFYDQQFTIGLGHEAMTT